MIKRFVLNNLSSFDGAMLVEDKKSLLVKIDVPYSVNDSQFSPLTSALKKIAGQSIPENVKSQVFDFPNGLGSPGPLPAGRNRSSTVAEVWKEVNDNLGVKNKILNEVQNASRIEKIKQNLSSKQTSTSDEKS